MLRRNTDFVQCVDDRINDINSLPNGFRFLPELTENAFVKIYVEMERLLVEYFYHYISGKPNGVGNVVPCNFTFADADAAKNFITNTKGCKRQFVGIKEIEELNEFFINDCNNPLKNFFTDADCAQNLREMKAIRNHLAHNSQESKHTYEIVFNSKSLKSLTPQILLLTKKKGTKITYFIKYCDFVKKIPQYLY
jgi:hypothetical protein